MRWLWGLALLALVVGLVLVWSVGRRPAEVRGIEGVAESGGFPQDDQPTMNADARSEVPPQGNGTVGEFLQHHWGPRWETVRERYSRANIALDQDLIAAGLAPWENVSDELRAEAEAIYERDTKFLAGLFSLQMEQDPDGFKASFHLDEDIDLQAHLPRMHEELAEVDYQFDLLLGRYMAEMDRAFEVLKVQGPVTSPLIDLPREEPPDIFHTIFVAKGGWYAAYQFSSREFPEFAEIQRERQDLITERYSKLREFAQSLR